MPTFIRLVNLTEDGAKNIDKMPQMIEEAQQVMSKYNTKVINDLVAVIDAPDALTAAKVSAKIAAQGNFRAETLAAVTMEEFMEGGTEELDIR